MHSALDPWRSLAGVGVAEIVRQHEVGNARRDLGAEARAVEHAVMADAGLQPVRLVRRREC